MEVMEAKPKLFPCHADIALLCLKYMTLYRSEEAIVDIGPDAPGKPFAAYAWNYWQEHVKDSSPLKLGGICNLLVRRGVHLMSKTWDTGNVLQDVQGGNPHHLCAQYNFFDLVKVLSAYPHQPVPRWPHEEAPGNLTPLLIAAQRNNVEVALHLIDTCGVDVNCLDSQSHGPLWYAARNRSPHLLQHLLQAPDIAVNSIETENGTTPLIIAIQAYPEAHSASPLVGMLLEHPDLDINITDSSGLSALYYAIMRNDAAVVQQLLTRREDAVPADVRGMLSHTLDTPHPNHTIIRLLLESPVMEVAAVNACLCSAVEYQQLYALKLLLRYPNVDVNTPNDLNETPLAMSAALEGRSFDFVDVLLQQPGIQTITYDKSNRTPLHSAIERGDTAVVQRFLQIPHICQHGLNIADGEGITPLLLAVQQGHSSIVECLLDCQEVVATLEKPDKMGRSIIWHAACSGHTTILPILVPLTSTQLLTRIDVFGVSPLHIAVLKGKFEFLKALLAPVVDANGGIVRDGDGRPRYQYPTVSQTLEHDDHRGNTIVWMAADAGNPAVLQYLQDCLSTNQRRVDFDKPNKMGVTPVARAALLGHEDILETLLGKDLIKAAGRANVHDSAGRTPFFEGATSGRGRTMMLFATLIGSGLGMQKLDSEGQTVIHAAVLSTDTLGWVHYVSHLQGAIPESAKPTFPPFAPDTTFATVKAFGVLNYESHHVLDMSSRHIYHDEDDSDEEGHHDNLITAIEAQHGSSLEALLFAEEYASVARSLLNRRDNYGRTALWYAAATNALPEIRYLLDRDDLDVNIADNDGVTPLMAACIHNCHSVVAELVKHPQLDPNTLDKNGRTALFYTIQLRHENVIPSLFNCVALDYDQGGVYNLANDESIKEELDFSRGELESLKRRLTHPKWKPRFEKEARQEKERQRKRYESSRDKITVWRDGELWKQRKAVREEEESKDMEMLLEDHNRAQEWEWARQRRDEEEEMYN
jgi:ankyrin repeat protein